MKNCSEVWLTQKTKKPKFCSDIRRDSEKIAGLIGFPVYLCTHPEPRYPWLVDGGWERGSRSKQLYSSRRSHPPGSIISTTSSTQYTHHLFIFSHLTFKLVKKSSYNPRHCKWMVAFSYRSCGHLTWSDVWKKNSLVSQTCQRRLWVMHMCRTVKYKNAVKNPCKSPVLPPEVYWGEGCSCKTGSQLQDNFQRGIWNQVFLACPTKKSWLQGEIQVMT